MQSVDPDEINNARVHFSQAWPIIWQMKHSKCFRSHTAWSTVHTFNLPHPGSARGRRMLVAIALFSASVLVTCFLLIGCKGAELHQVRSWRLGFPDCSVAPLLSNSHWLYFSIEWLRQGEPADPLTRASLEESQQEADGASLFFFFSFF